VEFKSKVGSPIGLSCLRNRLHALDKWWEVCEEVRSEESYGPTGEEFCSSARPGNWQSSCKLQSKGGKTSDLVPPRVKRGD
jgi:hypothetical protein